MIWQVQISWGIPCKSELSYLLGRVQVDCSVGLPFIRKLFNEDCVQVVKTEIMLLSTVFELQSN